MSVKVSIITVCLNSMKTIDQTIRSVLEQDYPNVEYIIMDGASGDFTVEIAETYREAFMEKGYNYKIYSSSDNGIYDAMNKGILHASGEVIGLLNSDDWYESNTISKMMEIYTKKKFDVFYGSLRIHKGNKTLIKKARLRNYITTRDWNHPTTFITKSVYENNQYACSTLYDDWDLILRLRKQGKKFIVEDEVLANFRFGGVSNEKNIRKAYKRCKIRYEIYRRNGYSRLYLFECICQELIKYILG